MQRCNAAVSLDQVPPNPPEVLVAKPGQSKRGVALPQCFSLQARTRWGLEWQNFRRRRATRPSRPPTAERRSGLQTMAGEFVSMTVDAVVR